MQSRLILAAKKDGTWKELADRLGVSVNYLAGDIRLEKVLVSKIVFDKLCEISGEDYGGYVIDILEDNWGKSKGGVNSRGSLVDIKIPEHCCELAEFVGAVLGDGHVHYTKKNSKGRMVGVYQIRITGDLRYEKEYHEYLAGLANFLFGIVSKYGLGSGKNERYLFLSSRELVEFFIEMGINPGNKIINQSGIPRWIFDNKDFLKACVRGLIDTDGSLHRMSGRDSHLLRINFKNHNYRLLSDVRKAFVLLGFHPCEITNGNIFYISRQEEVDKYLKDIGFSNKKHLDRLNEFRAL